ncbi:unnamed protein product, partial [Owenia fusiformis]
FETPEIPTKFYMGQSDKNDPIAGEIQHPREKHISVDIFRDTPLRYLGYANEVGEAFRALVHVNVVRLTYVAASSYVLADATSKANDASQLRWKTDAIKKRRMKHAFFDALIWQGLASVAIPGFTINRLCALSNYALQRSSRLPQGVRKWIVTAIGLCAIPIIIQPIDRSVDYMMNQTLRPWYLEIPGDEELIHHHRDD